MTSKPAIVRTAQMQNTGNAFEIKRPVTKNNLVHIQTAISKLHGNHKPKTYNRYTHKKEKAIQTQHERQTSNHKRTEEEGKKKDLQGFPGDTVVKNPPANAGDTGSSPGPGRSHMPWSN